MRSGACVLGFAVLVSACGGGGGDGGPAAGAPPIGATPLQITVGNYGVVAQESVSTTLGVTDASLLLTGAQSSNDTVALALMRAQIPKFKGWIAGAPEVVSGATLVERENCDSGFMDITVNDINNNNAPDAGDSINIVAQNCVFNGASVVGAMAFTINTISGDLATDAFSLGLSMTLTNLAVTDATGTVTSNARMTANVVSTGVNAHSFSFTASDYTMSSVRANVAYTRSLTNFSATLTTTPAGGGYTESLIANGTLGSTGLDSKSVTFATLTPFVRSSGQTFPASGVATSTGAGGSRIRITAQNATSVLVELDADGNSSFETSQTRLWSELI